MGTGRLNEIATIERVVLGHPGEILGDPDRVQGQWRDLGYLGPPDPDRALREHAAFASVFETCGVRITYLPPDQGATLDAIYVRDAGLVAPGGAILCNMGKAQRRAEPRVLEGHLREIGIPVRGAVTGSGRIEGGDVVWFDERTLAVGRGYRTNDEGIRQLRALLAEDVDEFVVVPLPHWKGRGDVFHLMSVLSPIDEDLALVYSPLLPVPFREWLLGRGIKLVEVAGDEFESLGCNALALAPRKCLMVTGNPRTRSRLEAEGVEVREFAGEEIARKGGGGATCLTRPIRRR